ncbi:hypothetical protein NEOLEDRAFT_617661 [Neolentinus lepideus HHB14362 ss-1]|uniref:Uncharacterized protein n=1 Tax=Neolentinus lepideus HHB14362 ss-1 TaxID=1314782 RepID=A0A165QVT8_9AGAM|nr:hypothetical protein NEOLEDRAFT_617661 [Neolentinus lepideus HHB14362 ss-1]
MRAPLNASARSHYTQRLQLNPYFELGSSSQFEADGYHGRSDVPLLYMCLLNHILITSIVAAIVSSTFRYAEPFLHLELFIKLCGDKRTLEKMMRHHIDALAPGLWFRRVGIHDFTFTLLLTSSLSALKETTRVNSCESILRLPRRIRRCLIVQGT